MKIARITKGIFGKSQCNTEMSTVIPINLKRGFPQTTPNIMKFYQQGANYISLYLNLLNHLPYEH